MLETPDLEVASGMYNYSNAVVILLIPLCFFNKPGSNVMALATRCPLPVEAVLAPSHHCQHQGESWGSGPEMVGAV